ncbi:eIF-2-alpha kinase GCN2 isoform X3 [Pseudoliparis swirei]|uniref:eIF-2-alpha kinase GCN2 isoform X3 n=1 Tax=Pseudoliparis swirei TaxID=2059687 RepID=UPI0024BD8F02|nr:eIF-2-alpha kinase GCN2 isoform X3 [Pseudoliparis swirei]
MPCRRGRRMSRQRTGGGGGEGGEGTDDYTVQQENELEALASIFGDDFQDLRTKDPWKVKRPPEVHLCLRPNGLNNGQECYVTVDLQVKCPPTYPDAPPELELSNAKGLSNENLQNLQTELAKLAAARCGEVMIYELADYTQGFLSEHNKPPPSSFHEEMLKNLRRQQEKRDQEEQQKMDQQRKQEEDMEKEIIAEIQRREEGKREEKRRKEIAKQERLVSMEQPCSQVANASSLGRRPPSPGGAPPELMETKKAASSRRRPTSNTRHRRDTVNEDNPRSQELLHFYSSTFGELVVHRGKSLGVGERLRRSVYYGFEENSGDFAVIYEWSLHWNKMGKFFTSQETARIENCKKQIHGAENEFNSLLRLDHPNLVRYMAMSSTEKDDRFVVNLLVEHVAGINLTHSLKANTPVPLDKLCHYTAQLLAALDYLHSNSVVHKQLGASSVLVDSEGNVRLTDYSLSKRFAEICKEDVFEQAHVRFSEDTAMPTKTGKKGDVWNLGLMLLALSQGKEVQEYPVTVPASLPASFQDFLQKCVCLNDAERWTAQQLLDHSFLKPPSPKNLPQHRDSSTEDAAVDSPSSVIPPSHINALFSFGVERQFSRYFNEFEELQLLGKGAFGAVIKVQNNLDGCYYAVKRIQVNPASKQFRRIKGEVTLLSRLNHENIVRYYNAWIERHEKPSSMVLSTTDSSEAWSAADKPPQAKEPPQRINELGLADNAEDAAPPPALSSSVEWSTSIERSSSAKCSRHQSSDEEDEDDEDVFGASFLPSDSDSSGDIIFDDGDGSTNEMLQVEPSKMPVIDTTESTDSDRPILIAHYLYIQMEYCEKSTLRDTIDQGLHQDQSRLWRLFREILDGLAYIHEQGMIHRDLKPVNIFLDSQDHVKIGDFGLATDHPANVAAGKCEVEESSSAVMPKPDPTGNMTGMVGTALYVSPEVQGNTKATYNQKVDLFSLGIILFEMSYRPMTTGAERISVLSQLRVEPMTLPEDFTPHEQGTQRKVMEWLLNHDPALRPTAQELLKSELLPPPQMEESELHEVLQHTMANVNGKAYRTMVGQLFAQNTSPVMDYTYDIDLHKGSFSLNGAKLQQHVYETITRIFKRHGAVRLQTPLLLPRNRKLYDGSEPACFMDHSGMLVTLPHDLRTAFSRFVARNNITHLKSIERVFRPRKLDRAHPRELLECAFDIITPVTNSLLPDAEIIYTVSEIVQEFAVLQERNYNIYLNHTSLFKAILLHSGVPEDKLSQASTILCDAMSEKLTKRELEAKFCNFSLSANSLQTLYKYIEQKGSLQDLAPLLTSLTKQKTAVTLLAKQGLKDLEELTMLLRRLGVKLQVVVNLGLVYKLQHHSGVIFQFVAFIRKRKRIVPDIVAAGGRYDHLILEFRGPASTVPVPSAVGASVALDKVCAALANMEEPPSVSSCDALVVPVGHSSMSRAINVVQKLWSSGVSADIAYDVLQSQETLMEHCRLAGISCMALVSDKEGHYVKVKSFEKDRQSEKRIPESDLVDHIIQKCRTKFFEERNIREISESMSQNPKGSLLNNTGSSEQHGSSSTSNINVNVISPDKVSSSVRRRYEAQIQTRLQNLGTNLQNKSNDIEVLAVDLLKETLVHFLTLEFDNEEQFNSSVKTLLYRLPKQRYLKSICDEIHQLKITKKVAVVVLYSYKDDYYKILL